jgi:hypothetical protein
MFLLQGEDARLLPTFHLFSLIPSFDVPLFPIFLPLYTLHARYMEALSVRL